MDNLIYVYGDAAELETALKLLTDAGLADKARVIAGRGEDSGGGRDDLAAEREGGGDRGHADDTLAGAGLVPPAAALGAHVPLGTTGGAMIPYAAATVAGDADAYADSRALADLDDLVRNDEEAKHYADVLRGGGSLLVIESGAAELDRAEQLLASHQGQGFARH